MAKLLFDRQLSLASRPIKENSAMPGLPVLRQEPITQTAAFDPICVLSVWN